MRGSDARAASAHSPPVADETFVLVDHDVSVARLETLIRRVGASMSGEEFIRAVNTAYYEVEARHHTTEIHEYFHRSGAHGHFRQALATAAQWLPRPLAILDIGCGAGYDLEVIREVFPRDQVELLVGLDVSADMMDRAGATADGYPCRMILGSLNDALAYTPFHLVVTHAMVHHIPNLAYFFRMIDRALPPGGIYLMGHEPNRRHWENLDRMPLLRRLQAAARRRRVMRKFLQPSRYIRRLGRMLGLVEDPSLESKVNRILREQLGFTDNLTPKELHRLIDIHVPDRLPGDFRIGFNGFDWNELGSTMLGNFQITSLVTYGYTLEATSPKYSPKNWERWDAALAKEHPLDGIYFTALWKKQGK
jgi:SAM-dependent methyltransferase